MFQLVALFVGLSVGGGVTSGCSSDCKGIGIVDQVVVVLPADIKVDEPPSVRVCLDQQCTSDGGANPLMLIVEGSTVKVQIGAGLIASQAYRVKLTVTGATPVDASIDTVAKAEQHGCDGINRTIRLRYDEQGKALRPA